MPIGAPVINPLVAPTPPFAPANVRHAYGIDQISFASGNNVTTGDGTGQTIAIVDAYSDPNIISDVAAFDTRYGLPAFNNADSGPTFTVLNEYGNASPLPTNTNSGTSSWDLEMSLDVEWAHAIAPQANIVLFEANTAGGDLYTAARTAGDYAGVSVVSLSWGGGEFSSESIVDSYFTTPADHPGVTYVVSSGDSGAGTEYPAASPNVLSVGGTSLTFSSNGDYSSERAWSGSGGAVSTYETQPSYQQGNVNGLSNSNRAVPDVAWLADPNTGVSVLDTWNGNTGASGYFQVGGTSLAAPMWAGLLAIIDQGRALNGQSSLDGPSQTLPQLYQLSSADFHDITTGSNGFAAQSGYDLVTGLGTPVTPQLVSDMVGVPSPAQSLAFTVQPSDAVSGDGSLSVTVEVLDGSGNLVTSDISDVTISLANNPGGATLSGTTTVQAVNGVATFTGLSLDKAAGGYTLVASDGSLTTATSNSFSVTPGAAQKVVVTAQPTNGVVGANLGAPVLISVEDAAGNVVTAETSAVTLTLTGTTFTDGTTSRTEVIAQYFMLASLGREGYRRVIQGAQDVAVQLSAAIGEIGPYELLSEGRELPVFAFRLKPEIENYTVFDISDRLRQNGWLVPAYTFPKNLEQMAVLRIVIRAGMTSEMADWLIEHLRQQTDFLQSLDRPLPGEQQHAFAHT